MSDKDLETLLKRFSKILKGIDKQESDTFKKAIDDVDALSKKKIDTHGYVMRAWEKLEKERLDREIAAEKAKGEKVAAFQESRLAELERKRLALEQDIANESAEYAKIADDLIEKNRKDMYDRLSFSEKASYDRAVANKISSDKKASDDALKDIKLRYDTEVKWFESLSDDKKELHRKEHYDKLSSIADEEEAEKSKNARLQQEASASEKKARQKENALENAKYQRLSARDKAEYRRKLASNAYESAKTATDEAVASGDPKKIADAKKEESYRSKQLDAANAQVTAMKALETTMAVLTDGLKNAVSIYTQYASRINTRLQGTDKTFTKMNDTIVKNIGTSPFFSQKKVIENISKLSEQGISFNLEERAFLMEAADKIATTFEANSATLSRLIRLQQSDSTKARLANEAYLTSFFNSMFEDSSYLTDMYDSVSSAILDANAQMSRGAATEFEFVVQKWLGSLYSLGLSQSAVNSIAGGLNMLGTGDVSGLAGNQQMQALFAMSANRAGLSYSDMLIGGLSASDTNALLEEMVKYLAEIADTDNQVVRSQFGQIFNMSMSDLRAISNLSTSDISNIAAKTMNYNQSLSELNYQMSQVIGRTTMAEMVNNVMDNFSLSIAEGVTNNPALFATYALNGLVRSATGGQGINIPAIWAAGFGLDMNASLNDLIDIALVGGGMMTQIPKILQSFTTLGGLNSLNSWGGKDTTSRGTGVSGLLRGLMTGTSESSYVGSASSSDMSKSVYSEAKESSKQYGIDPDAGKDDKTANDIYNMLFGDGNRDYVKVSYDHDTTVATISEAINISLANRTLNVNVAKVSDGASIGVKGLTAQALSKAIGEALSKGMTESMTTALYGQSSDEESEDGQHTLQDLINAIMDGTGYMPIKTSMELGDTYVLESLIGGYGSNHGGGGTF